MNQVRKKVAVLGVGVVGVSTAVWLQREGHDVSLIDNADGRAVTSRRHS